MLQWLRTGNPYTFFSLLFYALVVNFFYLLHPEAPAIAPLSDGILYEPLVRWLQSGGLDPQGFTILAITVLFLEAIILNALVNRFKLFSESSFFTAFSFLLISSFFPEWHIFSAPLIAGLPLLIAVRQLFKLYDSPTGRMDAFNLGLNIGITGLFYLPALALLLLVWFALLVIRPFKAPEWILAMIGLLCPWYFLATLLFLTGQLPLLTKISPPGFSVPDTYYSPKTMAGLIGLLVYFLYGSIRLQQVYSTKLIHIRKLWILLLAWVIIGLSLPFFPDQFDLNGWLIAFFPMSIFIACGFWKIKRRWFGFLLHFIALGFIFYLQWIK